MNAVPQKKKTLIEFPAELAVKAMGLAADDFEALVLELVTPALQPDEPTQVTRRVSRGDKYLSVSVHFTARDHDQLLQVYAALRAEPRVLYSL